MPSIEEGPQAQAAAPSSAAGSATPVAPFAQDAGLAGQHRAGFAALDAFWAEVDQVTEALATMRSLGPAHVGRQIDALLETVRAFEPSVGIVGQVKAGKSTLVNALIGRSGLLPADVNPWTSVITGLHLNSRARPGEARALFRFFDAEEWDRLTATGGRLGEIATRMGFASEADEVRAQVQAMRARTEARLGERFDRLLGKSHSFASLEPEIINRYVSDSEGAGGQEYLSDITRSADLYLDLPGYPTGLCLRDTPGVNDTFMMREQITLNAISESRVCVIVLSAHQALSTMDMGLLRLVLNVEAREVVFFVNRIDELGDVVAETRAIEAGIRATLGRAGLDRDVTVLFGAARWAERALEDRCEALAPASTAALVAWAEALGLQGESLRERAWEASGVGALHREICARVVAGPGKRLMDELSAAAANMVQQIETVEGVVSGAQPLQALEAHAPEAILARCDAIAAEALAGLATAAGTAEEDLAVRMTAARAAFVETAMEGVAARIAAYGTEGSWSCDPISLRMMVRTAFIAVTTGHGRQLSAAMTAVAEAYAGLLRDDLGVLDHEMVIAQPPLPASRAPSGLAATIALDMHAGWWRRLMRLGPPRSQAERYRGLIEDATLGLTEAVIPQHLAPYAEDCARLLAAFCAEQRDFVVRLIEVAEGRRQGRIDPAFLPAAEVAVQAARPGGATSETGGRRDAAARADAGRARAETVTMQQPMRGVA